MEIIPPTKPGDSTPMIAGQPVIDGNEKRRRFKLPFASKPETSAGPTIRAFESGDVGDDFRMRHLSTPTTDRASTIPHDPKKEIVLADSDDFTNTDIERLASALCKNTTAKTFAVDHGGLDSETFALLMKGLKANQSIESASFATSLLSRDWEPVSKAASKMLKENNTLKSLILENLPLGNGGIRKVLEAIAHKSPEHTLASLSVPKCGIGSPGLKQVARYLREGSPLTALDLSYNPLGNDGFIDLARALATKGPAKNPSQTILNTLVLKETGLKSVDAIELAIGIAQNDTLTHIHFGEARFDEKTRDAMGTIIIQGGNVNLLHCAPASNALAKHLKANYDAALELAERMRDRGGALTPRELTDIQARSAAIAEVLVQAFGMRAQAVDDLFASVQNAHPHYDIATPKQRILARSRREAGISAARLEALEAEKTAANTAAEPPANDSIAPFLGATDPDAFRTALEAQDAARVAPDPQNKRKIDLKSRNLLTLADLRSETDEALGLRDNILYPAVPMMYYAIRYKMLDQVIALARNDAKKPKIDREERTLFFKAEDFIKQPSPDHRTPLFYLIERGDLGKILQADLWVNNPEGLELVIKKLDKIASDRTLKKCLGEDPDIYFAKLRSEVEALQTLKKSEPKTQESPPPGLAEKLHRATREDPRGPYLH